MVATVFGGSRALVILEVARLTDDLEDSVLGWADPEIQGPVIGSQGLIPGLVDSNKELGHVAKEELRTVSCDMYHDIGSQTTLPWIGSVSPMESIHVRTQENIGDNEVIV